MDKSVLITDYKNNDFYFLFLRRLAQEDSGEAVTEHKWQEHSFFEIMLICEGEDEYIIENRLYKVKKGDVLLVKPGVHHYKVRTVKAPTAVYCLGFLPEAILNAGLAERIFDGCVCFSVGEDSPLREMFDVVRRKLEISKRNTSFFIKSIAEATVLLLYDICVNSDEPQETKSPTVMRMLDYIKENLPDIKKVEDISAPFFLSESHTRALFKKEMNVSIMEYVRNKKVLLAHRKIRHGGKPTEIYSECGFSNYPSFYRAYVAYFGYPPRMQKI